MDGQSASVRARRPRRPRRPPPTRQDNIREVFHGVEIVDPYRWLEDQDCPETRAWIDAQNEYTRSLLDGLPMRERISRRLTELLRVDHLGAPMERNGSYFFLKQLADQDLAVLYRRTGLMGTDEVLIDPHPMSADHTVSIGLCDVSSAGTLVAYYVRQGGKDETEIRLLDVESRTDLPDRLPRALYSSFSFNKKDNNGFYYAVRRRGLGPRVYYHTLGSDPGDDGEIFGVGYGPEQWISAAVSDDGRYLLLTVGYGWTRTELYFQDIAANGPITPIVNDIDAKFYGWFADDELIMQTDWQAPNHRILGVDLNDPKRENWREVVPTCDDAIQQFSLIGGKLFVTYLHNVTTHIKAFSLEGQPLGDIPLPVLGSGGIYGRWVSNEAFLYFSSFTVPFTIYRYDVATGQRDLWAQSTAPLEPHRFEVRQVWYTSKDGTKVPMFLVHKKGLEQNGMRPTLLHGYGGFNVSLTPVFNAVAILWAEQDGVYALANLRGGGEFGEAWHRAGMLDKKQNVFDDFIAAAEWLIAEKYTNPSKLAIQGVSNGGLLVGTALTQRAGLFQAVLCQFPDLDMVRYFQFTGSNNPPALQEYGNAADPEQFTFLYAYSPYHHVQPGTEYPAVLLTSGDFDTRVPPHQARKMTALLQWATGSDRPIMLHYDTKAGHAGGKPFSRVVEDLAMEQAFLFWQLGVD